MGKVKAGIIAVLFLSFTNPGSLHGEELVREPVKVLIFYSYGPDSAPFDRLGNLFRQRLAELSPRPVEFVEYSLPMATRDAETISPLFVDYLRAHLEKQPPDLVVAIGAPAARFCRDFREEIFPRARQMVLGLDRRRLPSLGLAKDVVVFGVDLDLRILLRNILDCLPETRRVHLVFGMTPFEQFWFEALSSAFKAEAPAVEIRSLSRLSLAQMRDEVSGLTDGEVVLVGILNRDASGVSHVLETGLEVLSEASSVPLFGYADQQLGLGIVGGSLTELHKIGKIGAEAAERLLRGEDPGQIESVFLPLGEPVYDHRALVRWDIPESRLPEGSRILYRRPALWETHRRTALIAVSILILQSLLISKLLQARSRARALRATLDQRRDDLAHLSRVSTLQVVSASLAHEVNLPLGVILSNAQAAEDMINRGILDKSGLLAILEDIVAADRRATDVLLKIRRFVRRENRSFGAHGLDELFRESMTLLGSTCRDRGVRVESSGLSGLPKLRCDPVEIQQVLINLILNGCEAVCGLESERRVVMVSAIRAEGRVRVSIEDRGRGFSEDPESLFDPFHTTRSDGMGLGLAISRLIVEAHGGSIRGESLETGAVFRFEIPVAGDDR